MNVIASLYRIVVLLTSCHLDSECFYILVCKCRRMTDIHTRIHGNVAVASVVTDRHITILELKCATFLVDIIKGLLPSYRSLTPYVGIPLNMTGGWRDVRPIVTVPATVTTLIDGGTYTNNLPRVGNIFGH